MLVRSLARSLTGRQIHPLTHASTLVPSDTGSFINSVFSWLCCGLLSGTIETSIIKLRLVCYHTIIVEGCTETDLVTCV